MTSTERLGEFEQLVLLAVARLGEDGYGTTIRRELERRASRAVTVGALYATLERLELKGLVRTREGEPTARRGGRAKRYYALTAAGVAALQDARRALERMWEGLELPARGRRT
jgi:PadR family transcriptional regulator, regulatory protein PadR